MTQLASLLWKEWREAAPYLWIGLGLFVGMPAVKCVEDTFHLNTHLDFAATPWVLPLGGVLAVFVAVGVTTRDLRPRLEDFWRSWPIGARRWLAAKYAVALAVVLLACGLPLAIELALDRPADAEAGTVLAFFPFVLTALFSLAFLAGCLIPRPSHAATIGLAAMLLFYMLPVIVPPLAWLNVDTFTGPQWEGIGPLSLWLHVWGPPQFAAAGAMLGLSAVAVTVAVVAVGRGWRIESGRRLLYALVATAFLLLFASAAFQLGTNLPVLQQVELPADQRVRAIRLIGAGGIVISDIGGPSRGTAKGRQVDPHVWSRAFSLSPGGIALEPPIELDGRAAEQLAWPPEVAVGDFAFYLDPWGPGEAQTIRLRSVSLTRHTTAVLNLWNRTEYGRTDLLLWHNRLYVIGNRLDIVDVSQPDRPRVLSDVPYDGVKTLALNRGTQLQFPLLPLPDVPPERRLRATADFAFGHGAFDGSVLCEREYEPSYGLAGYRLSHLGTDTATFDRIGTYRQTPLQRAFIPDSFRGFFIVNGWVYTGFDGDDRFNASVTVIDTRGDRPMREVGHFAAPGAEMIRPLPDGRAIVGGGNKLWLVGAPARWGG